MQRAIIIQKSRSGRLLVYFCLVFAVSTIVGFYLRGIWMYFGFFLVFLSILYEVLAPKISLEAFILPKEFNSESLKLVLNGIDSYFWAVRRYIILNNWVYIHLTQQGSNNKIKVWLHRSNFNSHNDIRELAKYVLLSRNNEILV